LKAGSASDPAIMTAPRKVLAVTGSRADWGHLAPPLALLRDDQVFDLKVVVTGQHLVEQGTASLAAIAADGFAIEARVDMLLSADSAVGVAKSLGLAVIGFADVLAQLQPDLLLVLGDRYEILAAVQAALIARIPVAHLAGGDLTEGTVDEAIRHSITKMSHLHFVTNAVSAQRVRQLGENPDRIHNVGSTGLDRIGMVKPMPRDAFFDSIGLMPRSRNAVVTFHPVTLAPDSGRQCNELLTALDRLGSEFGLIFTGVNADTGSRSLDASIRTFCEGRDNAVAVASLGSEQYFSALTHVDVVIGNSSSGLYEAPSFHVPTVNIGDRQAGRTRAVSVIDCAPEWDAILAAIERALVLDCSDIVNPYGDGHASERIVAILKQVEDPKEMLKKRFLPIQ
jgi:UDP-hydrolysing UDP-N-acetyl-D-glucosamine 2-epimerase